MTVYNVNYNLTAGHRKGPLLSSLSLPTTNMSLPTQITGGRGREGIGVNETIQREIFQKLALLASSVFKIELCSVPLALAPII